jgi:hypothetical protein
MEVEVDYLALILVELLGNLLWDTLFARVPKDR